TLIHLPQILADPQSIFWPRSLSPFFLMVLVYALCEGSFGSWASVYLHTTAHPGSQAGTLALSAFWGSMTCFRLLLAPLPETWLSRRKLLLLSATGIAACFILIPLSSSTGVLIALFACAGAACSIYYPFTMALSLARFPEENTQVAGLLVAALMMGEGIGSYGIGWLQAFFSLKSLYLASAVWGIFLFIGAWYMTRAQRSTSPLSK
ncbi:MAG: MFS transporter, partial [Pseudomonadota bacterium]|nr:MFS transporter [Pseudomonadota bacterium]